jgi:hypothetical protein
MSFLLLLVLLALPLTASQAVLPSAESQGPVVAPTDSPQVQNKVTSGTIVDLDAAFLKLSVRDGAGHVQPFTLSSVTPILDHFKPVSFQSLRLGDRVTVTYTEAPAQVVSVEKQ